MKQIAQAKISSGVQSGFFENNVRIIAKNKIKY